MAELDAVPAGVVTLRPPSEKDRSQRQLWSPATQRLRLRAAWVSFFALCVWTGALALRNGGQWIWLPLGLAIVLVVVLIAIVVNKRLVTRAYIRVDGESVERLSAFGGPTLIPRAQIVRMQRCLLRLSGGLASSTVAYVLLLDAHGKCVMHLQAQVWGKANIDTLRSVLQIPADGSWDDPTGISYRVLRKRFPGSFAWWQANMMWLIAAVLVVGILGGSIIYVYATGQAG
jgi:hypothetical protein